MRIGTWNLDNRRLNKQHFDLIHKQQCDVWLLTELNPRSSLDSQGKLDGFYCHMSSGVMARGQHWAAVCSVEPLTAYPDPHPASASAMVRGIMFCSTILPWRGAPSETPWSGHNHAAKTATALNMLLTLLPKSNLVWGGDWNHAFGGTEFAGSKLGREHLRKAIKTLELTVATEQLGHRIPGCFTIDHIALPAAWRFTNERQITANGLSDHDAYVVDAILP